MKLTNKRAVITGARQGLGRTIAEAFLLEGASVLILARSPVELERARSSLDQTAPGRVHAMVCNIAMLADVDELAREAEMRLGGVDIVVANAGVNGPKGAIEDVEWA